MKLRGLVVIMLFVLGLAPACVGGGGADGGAGSSGAIEPRDPVGAPGDRLLTGDADVMKAASVDMRVEKGELGSAAQAVVDVATTDDTGGFLVSSVVERRAFADIRVKVPSPTFETVIADMERIGTITRQEIEGRDLSRTFLAINARLREVRTRIASLLQRLEETEDPGVRFELSAALREARIKEAKLERNTHYVEGITTYATIDVTIEGMPPPAAPPKPVWERSLDTAKKLTMGIASGALLTAGVVVPLGVLALVVYLLGTPLVRRFRQTSWSSPTQPLP